MSSQPDHTALTRPPRPDRAAESLDALEADRAAAPEHPGGAARWEFA
ncbi:MAG TPA: hypothetical protein VMI33_09540 [Streptosporangiaceae bacterium]|nr:hypothetical protein [Streptosporangiaceae bacterium]